MEKNFFQHIHLDECQSTQKELMALINANPESGPIIISTSKQTSGVGRSQNRWVSPKNSIAFSFSLESKIPPTLIPLLIGAALCQFLKQYSTCQCLLKWPNDLLSSNKEKLGGIICNMLSEKKFVIGIGINIQEVVSEEHFKQKAGMIQLNTNISQPCSQFPKMFCEFLINLTWSASEIVDLWNGLCIHHNQQVIIENEAQKIQGIFKGIGAFGEAIIATDNTKHHIYAGSLFFID